MPDGPRGRGDEPEYDWLYGARGQGGAGAPPPQSDDPEPTRMMPVIPRPETSGDGPGGPRRTSTATAAPPPRPTRAPEKNPREKKRSPWRIVRIVLLVWLVFLIAVPVWAWSRIDKVDAFPRGDRRDRQRGTTYLLVGSDSRENLSKEQRKRLGTGDAAGRRTDTIMLLHAGSG